MAHVIFESSRIKATNCGHIYDVLVNSTGANGGTNVEADNGTLVIVNGYTGDGLQERYAKKATAGATGDIVAVLGTPALIKDAFTKAQSDANQFTNVAGRDAKAYELVADDIFAVSADAFEDATKATVGAKLIVGSAALFKVGTGKEAGFRGEVHSISTGDQGTTMIRIRVVATNATATA